MDQRRKVKNDSRCCEGRQKQLRDWWSRGADLRRRVDGWEVLVFGSTTQKLTPGRKRSEGSTRRMRG